MAAAHPEVPPALAPFLPRLGIAGPCSGELKETSILHPNHHRHHPTRSAGHGASAATLRRQRTFLFIACCPFKMNEVRASARRVRFGGKGTDSRVEARNRESIGTSSQGRHSKATMMQRCQSVKMSVSREGRQAIVWTPRVGSRKLPETGQHRDDELVFVLL